MPASPEDGATLAQRVLELIAEAEAAILRLIASRLRAGLGSHVSADEWGLQKLRELQMVRQYALTQMGALTPKLVQQVHEIVLDAYNVGQALAFDDIEKAGHLGVPAPDPVHLGAQFAQAAVDNVQAATRAVPDLIANVYQQAVQAGVSEVLGGDVTRLNAAQHVLDQLATRGVTGFQDRAGRNWSLESYVEMAVRTGAGNAAVQGHVDALAASGLDLIIVSDAPRECPLCRPWERQVLSISGQVGRIIEPAADSGRAVVVDVKASYASARAAGLQHPNCRHTISLYSPGVTKIGNATAQPDRYEAGQRQREIERKIREWKRRQAVALDDNSARVASGKVREWQAAMRQHIDANDLTRLPKREQIGRAR